MSTRALALLEHLQQQKKLADSSANVRAYWDAVGRKEPYWGVLTHDEYKGQNKLTADSEEAFFASGAAEVEFLESVLRMHADVLGGRTLVRRARSTPRPGASSTGC